LLRRVSFTPSFLPPRQHADNENSAVDDTSGFSYQFRMPLNISPEEEALIVRLAARIRGARGGAARTTKKIRSSRRNVKRALKARMELVAA